MEQPVQVDSCAVTHTDHRPLTLEVGGTNKSSKPSNLPASAVVIDAAKLPNPYTAINSKALDLSAPKIIDWMETKNANTNTHLEAMIYRAKAALSSRRSVRVHCFGGKHRSQALAWKILQSLDKLTLAEVEVICLDCAPLPELEAFVRASP
jgi:RNase adaptor protein for sRNA GlmZ degradation